MAGSWKSVTPPSLGQQGHEPRHDAAPDRRLVLVHHAYGNAWLRLAPDDKGDYGNPSCPASST